MNASTHPTLDVRGKWHPFADLSRRAAGTRAAPQHAPDFAVGIGRPVRIRAAAARPDGGQGVEGDLLAIGWSLDPDRRLTGSDRMAYLVLDSATRRLVWLADEEIDELHAT